MSRNIIERATKWYGGLSREKKVAAIVGGVGVVGTGAAGIAYLMDRYQQTALVQQDNPSVRLNVAGVQLQAITETQTPTPTQTPTVTEQATQTPQYVVVTSQAPSETWTPYIIQVTETPTETSNPTSTSTDTATSFRTATSTNTLVPIATETSEPTVVPERNLTHSLAEYGIKVDLRGLANVPLSAKEVATRLSHGDVKILPEQVVPIIITLSDGTQVWRGGYMIEAFQVNTAAGVVFDANDGLHKDKDGRLLTEVGQIFDFNGKPELLTVKLDQDGVWLFGAVRGKSGEGEKSQQYYFTGVKDTVIREAEQFTYYPVPVEDICPGDARTASSDIAFRVAVAAFRDDPAVRDGFPDGDQHLFVGVNWLNPETKLYQPVNGRLIAKLTQEGGYDMSFIDRLPGNFPLSPEDVSNRFNGNPKKWIFIPENVEWGYEGFAYKDGVNFVDGVGPVNAEGKVLVGDKQTANDTTEVFNFGKVEDMLTVVKGGGNLPVIVFVRAGGAAEDPSQQHTGRFTFGDGDVIAHAPSFEQVRVMLATACPPDQIKPYQKLLVKDRAQKGSDPMVTYYYYNGALFTLVHKN